MDLLDFVFPVCLSPLQHQLQELNIFLQLHMLKFKPLGLLNVTLFGERVFKEVIRLKWGTWVGS
jgi:hypothetical protein